MFAAYRWRFCFESELSKVIETRREPTLSDTTLNLFSHSATASEGLFTSRERPHVGLGLVSEYTLLAMEMKKVKACPKISKLKSD
jgi:hypothetical protein